MSDFRLYAHAKLSM